MNLKNLVLSSFNTRQSMLHGLAGAFLVSILMLVGCGDSQPTTSIVKETNVLDDAPTRLVFVSSEGAVSGSTNQLQDAIDLNGSVLSVKDEATTNFAGVYSLGAPIYSEILITTVLGSTNQWQVQFYAKGDPDDAEGIGADCYFVTQGVSVDSTLTVAPIPFETKWYAITEDLIDSADRFDIQLHNDDQAEVTGYTSQCGTRVYATGNYQRIDAMQSLHFAYCTSTEAQCAPR